MTTKDIRYIEAGKDWEQFRRYFLKDRAWSLKHGDQDIQPAKVSPEDMTILGEMGLEILGPAFYVAARRGDEKLTEAIGKLLGETQFKLVDDEYRYLVEFKDFSVEIPRSDLCTEPLEYARSVDRAFSILKTVRQKVGAEPFLRKGPWRDLMGSSLITLGNLEEYSDFPESGLPLPILEGDVVSNPGLVYGLKAVASFGRDAAWYADAFCWATKEMLEKHPKHLLPYTSDVSLSFDLYSKLGLDSSVRSMAEIEEFAERMEREGDKDIREKLILCLRSVHMGVEADGRDASPVDLLLPAYLLSKQEQFGSKPRPDLVLSRTTVEFLDERCEPYEGDDFRDYAEALSSYKPISLMAARSLKLKGLSYSEKRDAVQRNAVPVARLFMLMSADPKTASAISEIFPAWLLEGLIHRQIEKMVTAPMVTMFTERFGVPLKPYKLHIENVFEVAKIVDSGFRVHPGSNVEINGLEGSFEASVNMFKSLIGISGEGVSIHGYPITMPIPELLQTLVAHLDTPADISGMNAGNTPVLCAIARNYGIEAFVPHLDSDMAWDVAEKVFSLAGLKSVKQHAPRGIRTRLAGQTLSL